MKLTTMKISVPVLMLMMFQSGYGVSDWFAKAWSAMNQGKTAEAFAVVQQQKPEKVGKLSAEQAIEFKKDWSKAVSDAVTNVLPLYYADKMRSGEEGEALRDAMIKLGNDGIMTSGKYATLDDTAGLEINTANVNRILQGRIVATANISNLDEDKWLLPDAAYISGEDTGKGIHKWVKTLIEDWNKSNGDTTKSFDTVAGKIRLFGKLANNDFDLRKDFNMAIPENSGIPDDDAKTAAPEIATFFDTISPLVEEAQNAKDATDGTAETTKTSLTRALRNALLDVLVNRIQNPTGADNDEKLQYKNNQLRYFIQTYRDRVVTDGTSKTIIGYDDISDPNDPLEAILAKAGTTPTVDSISNAVDEVISADLSLLLRHTGSVDVDTLDNAIVTSLDVEASLQSVAQTFDNATASSIVSNLKAIKNN